MRRETEQAGQHLSVRALLEQLAGIEATVLIWANRDDLTMGKQLGWTPPTPIYLAKMLLTRRQLRGKTMA